MKYRRILAVGMFLLAAGAVAVAVYLWSRPTASVSWQTESLVVAETGSPVGLTAELSETVSETVTVELELRGTVRPGRYSVTSAVLTIPPGQLLATTSLSLTSNGRGLAGEEITAEIVGVENAAIGARDEMTISIVATADDPGVTPAPTSTLPAPTTSSTSTTSPSTSTTTVDAERGPSLGDLDVSLLAEVSTGGTSAPLERFETRPDSILLLMVSNSLGGGMAPLPAVAGSGLDWELVESVTRGGGPRRLSMFRAATGAGGPVELSLDFDSSQGLVNALVVEVQNAPTEGNGGRAVVQTESAAAGSFDRSASVALAPLQSSGNITVGAFFTGANEAEGIDGFETVGSVGRAKRLLIAVVGNDPTVATAQWSNGAHWLGIAVEITNQQ